MRRPSNPTPMTPQEDRSPIIHWMLAWSVGFDYLRLHYSVGHHKYLASTSWINTKVMTLGTRLNLLRPKRWKGKADCDMYTETYWNMAIVMTVVKGMTIQGNNQRRHGHFGLKGLAEELLFFITTYILSRVHTYKYRTLNNALFRPVKAVPLVPVSYDVIWQICIFLLY